VSNKGKHGNAVKSGANGSAMHLWKRAGLTIGLLLASLTTAVDVANAQFFVNCLGSNSIGELENSIRAHNEHIYRLRRKFPEYWYFQGKVPEEVLQQGNLRDVEEFLGKLSNRTTAVLFYGYDQPNFCSWLIWREAGHNGRDKRVQTAMRAGNAGDLLILQDVKPVGDDALLQLETLRGAIHGRGIALDPGTGNPAGAEEALSKASNLLLPPRISGALQVLETDTLVIVPITIREKDERFASIGTVPFSALRIEDDPLIDRMSVIVAPGFYVFTGDPGLARRTFHEAIIVGDPDGTLPGARLEAINIGADLEVSPLIGAEATIDRVSTEIRGSASIDLLHMATHGIADAENPLDESYLKMHGGQKWTARQISKVKLPNRPNGIGEGFRRRHDRPGARLAMGWSRWSSDEFVERG
jgi:hypothetical protein